MNELLTTKLYIPRPRPNLVSRPRLTERLNAGLDKELTLIAAPAGFGKTTLLSEWIPQSPHCVTWLSLDEGDNDPTKFWAYFISSLQQLHPDLAGSALALLQSAQAPPIKTILTAMINDIAAFPDVFCSVLDDYHLIEFQPVHDALAFLIAHLPANMHLVITTRVDPPWPLARLRARDKMTEFRANDLRFTAEETAAFLNQVMGLSLSAEEAAALENRTEGWIAGLQIAALTMQGREDVQGFIRAFSGSHRHILGYLADEVINQRPKGTLNFLLQTSILDRLCGPLCDAVTASSGSQTTLESLEHANLFITPLDDEGVWYRYHHLFAEVLQARLRQSQPELLDELHDRASEWYESHNSVVEAVQHALAADNALRAADLIERERWTLLGRGEANTLHRWLDELPAEIVSARPGLSLAYAWIFSLLEYAEAIEPHLQAAEKALAVNASKTPDEPVQIGDAIRGEIATLRAETALSQWDIPRAIELCQNALKLLPEDKAMMRGVTTYFLGHGERRSGHMAEAERVYARASALGLQTDNLLLALHALANLSSVQITMGRLKDAAETSQRILQITAKRRRQAWPVAGLAYQGLGKLHYEWNNLDEAERFSRLGIKSGQRGGMTGLEVNSRSVLTFTLQARHDSSGADQVMQQIAALAEQHHHPVHAASAAALEARLRLVQGHTAQAVHWAKTCGLHVDDDVLPYSHEAEYLTLAQVLIAQGRSEGVPELLVHLLEAAKADQRTGSLIQILTLQALVRQIQGDLPGALDVLERALALAQPEGYVRTFIDEGEPLRALLNNYRKLRVTQLGTTAADTPPQLLTYVNRLLAAFPLTGAPAGQQLEPYLEPLSERELEVLRLVATGASNREIANTLIVAVPTVKKHVSNILSKLNATSRTQAVTEARTLGLL